MRDPDSLGNASMQVGARCEPRAHLAGNVHGHVLRGGGGDVADLAVVAAGAQGARAAHVHPSLVLAPAQVRLRHASYQCSFRACHGEGV